MARRGLRPGPGARARAALPVSIRRLRTLAALLPRLLAAARRAGRLRRRSPARSSRRSGGRRRPRPTPRRRPRRARPRGRRPDAGGAAPAFPANAEPDTEAASADAPVTVSDLRAGRQDGFDRVVFEVGGTGTPGWDVRYVDAAVLAGQRRAGRRRGARGPPGDAARAPATRTTRRGGVSAQGPVTGRRHRDRHGGRLRRHLRGHLGGLRGHDGAGAVPGLPR